MDCLENTLNHYGRPEIFNSDQGSQFTSGAFTGLQIEKNITISMDRCGRTLDNIFVECLWSTVKYEEIYLKKHDSLPSLLLGLTAYLCFTTKLGRINRWITKRQATPIRRLRVAAPKLWISLVRGINNPPKRSWGSAKQL